MRQQGNHIVTGQNEHGHDCFVKIRTRNLALMVIALIILVFGIGGLTFSHLITKVELLQQENVALIEKCNNLEKAIIEAKLDAFAASIDPLGQF